MVFFEKIGGRVFGLTVHNREPRSSAAPAAPSTCSCRATTTTTATAPMTTSCSAPARSATPRTPPSTSRAPLTPTVRELFLSHSAFSSGGSRLSPNCHWHFSRGLDTRHLDFDFILASMRYRNQGGGEHSKGGTIDDLEEKTIWGPPTFHPIANISDEHAHVRIPLCYDGISRMLGPQITSFILRVGGLCRPGGRGAVDGLPTWLHGAQRPLRRPPFSAARRSPEASVLPNPSRHFVGRGLRN